MWEKQARAGGEALTVKEVLAAVVYPKDCEVLERREVENLMVGLGWPPQRWLTFVVATNHAGQLGVLCLPYVHGPAVPTRWQGVWKEFAECNRTNRAAMQPLISRLDASRIRMSAQGKPLTWHWYHNVLAHLRTGLLLSLGDGRRGEAMRWLRRMMRWLELPAQRVVFGDQAFRRWMTPACFQMTWTVLESGAWGEAALAELAALWEEQEYLQALAPTLEFERARWLELYPGGARAIHRDHGHPPGGFGPYLFVARLPAVEPDLRHLPQIIGVAGLRLVAEGHYLLWRNAWSDTDKLWLAQTMQRGLERLRQLARGSNSTPFSLPAIAATNAPPFRVRVRCPLGLLLHSEIAESEVASGVRAQVMRNLVLTAIAVKRFRLRHGELPRTLEELVPELLPKLPWDYYAGRPLTYRRTSEEAFLHYSWEEVGHDDQGVLDGATWLESSDLIWPRALLPEVDEPEDAGSPDPEKASQARPSRQTAD